LCRKREGENHTKQRTGQTNREWEQLGEKKRVVSKKMHEKWRRARETKRVSRGPSRGDALHKQELFLFAWVHVGEDDLPVEVLRRHGLLLVAMGGVPILAS